MIPLTKIILAMILLTSCATPLYFEKTVAPEIAVDIKPCRIAFVNIFNYTNPKSVKAENQRVYGSAINQFGSAINKIGLNDSIFKFFLADTLFRGVSSQNQSVLLSEDTVMLLTSVYRADYLLTLDSLSFFLQEDESDDQGEGGFQLIFSNYSLIGDFFLSLYSLSGDLINRSEVAESVKYGDRSVLLNIFNLRSSFSKAIAQAGSLGIGAADDYADKFFPVVTQEQRYVYTGRRFRDSNSLIVKEEFDKAAEILNKLSKSSNPDLVQKAEHNLSVLNEVKESAKARANP